MTDPHVSDETPISGHSRQTVGKSCVLEMALVYSLGLMLTALILTVVWYGRFGSESLSVIGLALLVSITTMAVNYLTSVICGHRLESFLLVYLHMGTRIGVFAASLLKIRNTWPQLENSDLTLAFVLSFLGTLTIETTVSVLRIQQAQR